MKYFSTFTGVGGFDLGVPEDWECVGMSEIDKYANMVLRYKYKDVKNYGDIEKINYEELPDYDVQIGGSPCQDVSVAGRREGLAGLRSRLFFSYVALLKVKQPRYFIFENVKVLLSSNEGRDFAEVVNSFSEAGYSVWWEVLSASDVGIPQHRERVFIFGTLGKASFRKVFFERKGKGENTKLQGQQANTITRRYRQSQSGGTYIAKHKLTQIDNLSFSRNQAYRVYGVNGVAPTLHRHTGGGQITKIGIQVMHEIETIHFDRQQQNRVYGINGTAPTLLKRSWGDHTPKIGMPVRQVNGRGKDANGRRFKTPDEPSFTLQSTQRHGVAFDNMDIRYLTPLECERLMGWPDNQTKYGIDEKGSTVELSDNARYNLIGNGVVPQAVRAIIKNIMEVKA